MVKEKSLFENYIFNFIKTLNGILFPIITFTWSTRTLGVTGVGRVNFAKSVIIYFTMIAMLGMNYYGTRETAKLRNDREKLSKFCVEMLMINGCTTLFAYGLLTIALCSIPRLDEYTSLLLICSAAILLQSMGMEWLYQGLEEYRYIAARSTLFQIIALIAMFAFVQNESDVVPYTVITVMASSGSYILNFINARKYIHLNKNIHYEIKKHLKPLLWLFAMAVSIELYTVLDSTMLGFIKGDVAVGLYTAAIKIEKMINTLILSIGVVLMPRLSFYISRGEMSKMTELVKTAYNYIFMLSVPATVGVFMLSDDIILLFSGSKFVAASQAMRIMAPIVLLIPFSVMTNQQTLIPMGKEKLILISTCVGAITNFALNRLLIPRYAQNGAAVGTLLAEAAVAFVCMINLKRYFDIKVIFRTIWQYFIASFPIPLIVALIGRWNLHYVASTILAIIISAATYFLILMLLKNPYIGKAVTVMQNRAAERKEQFHQ